MFFFFFSFSKNFFLGEKNDASKRRYVSLEMQFVFLQLDFRIFHIFYVEGQVEFVLSLCPDDRRAENTAVRKGTRERFKMPSAFSKIL